MNTPVPDFRGTNDALDYGRHADASKVAAMSAKIDNLSAMYYRGNLSLDEKGPIAFQIQFLHEAVRAWETRESNPEEPVNAKPETSLEIVQ